jgi:hypothetical protein
MANDNTLRILDRRSFLRGSALFAGAVGLTAVSSVGSAAAEARNLTQQKPKPEEKPEEKPRDPFGPGEQKKDGKLYDKEGREYKVCPQCGYNMYKQGKMWVCENCGYSYVE